MIPGTKTAAGWPKPTPGAAASAPMGMTDRASPRLRLATRAAHYAGRLSRTRWPHLGQMGLAGVTGIWHVGHISNTGRARVGAGSGGGETASPDIWDWSARRNCSGDSMFLSEFFDAPVPATITVP